MAGGQAARGVAGVRDDPLVSLPASPQAWDAAELTCVEPGPWLAFALASGDSEASSDDAILEAVVAFRKLIAWATVGAARAAAALAERDVMNPPWPTTAGRVTVTDVTGEELALALGCSRRAARTLVSDGRAYDGALGPTGDALGRGEIDPAKARVLIDALSDASVPLALDVQDAVLPTAATRTPSQLARDVAKALITADPAGAASRHECARRGRHVDRPRFLADGMAGLWAVLPARQATRIDALLDLLARSGRQAGDPRTLDQLRADLLVDLTLGELTARSAAPVDAGTDAEADTDAIEGPERPVGRRPAIRSEIRVLVPLDTLLGRSDAPGELAGYGPITAQTARSLAAEPASTWRRIVTDPVSGAVLDVGRTRYRPPADLADHVRARDRWCARPGCSAQAGSCDLDHSVEYGRDDGPTSHANLGPLCPRDHQVKTDGGFRLRQVSPGTFEWTTPVGRRYRVRPGADEAYRELGRNHPDAEPPF